MHRIVEDGSSAGDGTPLSLRATSPAERPPDDPQTSTCDRAVGATIGRPRMTGVWLYRRADIPPTGHPRPTARSNARYTIPKAVRLSYHHSPFTIHYSPFSVHTTIPPGLLPGVMWLLSYKTRASYNLQESELNQVEIAASGRCPSSQ